jgi:hypothetical protein
MYLRLLLFREWTAQSVQRLATGWGVRGSNPGVGKIFLTCPEWPWGPPSLLYDGYRVFPGGKAAGAWPWTSTTSRAQVKERVELYLYSPTGPSWHVLRWTLLYYTITVIRISLKSIEGSGLSSRSCKFSVSWKLICHYAKYSGEWCVVL